MSEQPLVTTRDMYDQLVRLTDEVRSMKPFAEELVDHEARIRALEKWRWSLPTSLFLAASSVISTILFTFVK